MIRIQGNLPIPEGVKVSLEKGVFTVEGPKGVIKRKLHSPRLAVEVVEGEVRFSPATRATLREKKLINTFKAHLRNMFKGVQQGHQYRLKVCSSHFPMSVALKGEKFEVKNFMGENVPRTVALPQGAKVEVQGEEILVEGIDKELVSRTAALIERLTRRPGFDSRIFQDGIYIIDKDGKQVS